MSLEEKMWKGALCKARLLLYIPCKTLMSKPDIVVSLKGYKILNQRSIVPPFQRFLHSWLFPSLRSDKPVFLWRSKQWQWLTTREKVGAWNCRDCQCPCRYFLSDCSCVSHFWNFSVVSLKTANLLLLRFSLSSLSLSFSVSLSPPLAVSPPSLSFELSPHRFAVSVSLSISLLHLSY